MSFLLGFVLLTIAALFFILLPLISGRQGRAAIDDDLQKQFNQALYDDSLQQINEQLKNAEIDDATHKRLVSELEKQLEQDQSQNTSPTNKLSSKSQWILYGATVVLVPTLAVVLYQIWGAAPDWKIYQVNIEKVRSEERSAPAADIRELNEQLKSLLVDRVEQRQDNLQNVFLLARTHSELGEYQEAVDSYQKILVERPQSPDVLSELAQVTFLANGRQFSNEVKSYFDQAVALSPQSIRVLSFAGMTAYEGKNYQAALPYWEQAVALSQPNTEQYRYMMQALVATQNQLQAAGVGTEVGQSQPPSGPTYNLTVSLGNEVTVDPNLRVFIYARAWQGPRMPLAIQEAKVSDLPLTLELDESMNPGMPMKLSQFEQIELVARVSLSGVSNAQSGDWEASLGPVNASNQDEIHQLVITTQRP